MTDNDVRVVCRLIVALLATAKLTEWVSAALPFDGWLYAITMTVAVVLMFMIILGAISEPAKRP